MTQSTKSFGNSDVFDDAELFADSSRAAGSNPSSNKATSSSHQPKLSPTISTNPTKSAGQSNEEVLLGGNTSLSLALQESLGDFSVSHGAAASQNPNINLIREDKQADDHSRPQVSRLSSSNHESSRGFEETARSVVSLAIDTAMLSTSNDANVRTSVKSVEQVKSIDSRKEIPLTHRKKRTEVIPSETSPTRRKKERSIFIIKKKDTESARREVPLIDRFMAQVQQDIVAGDIKSIGSNLSYRLDGTRGGSTFPTGASASSSLLRPVVQILKSMDAGYPTRPEVSSVEGGGSQLVSPNIKPSLRPLRGVPNISTATKEHTARPTSSAALGPVGDYLKLRRDGTDPRSHTQITPNGVVLVRTRPRVMCYGAGRVISVDPAAYASPSKTCEANSTSMADDLRQTANAFRGKTSKAESTSPSVRAFRQSVAEGNQSPLRNSPKKDRVVPPSERRVLYDVPI